MNKRVFNVLRKIAAEPEVKESQPKVPFDYERYWSERADAGIAEYKRRRDQKDTNTPIISDLLHPTNLHYAYMLRTPSAYARIRPSVASHLARTFMGLTPGSDKYNQAVKYFMNRGDTTMYNYLNPSNPKPNPTVPEILKTVKRK